MRIQIKSQQFLDISFKLERRINEYLEGTMYSEDFTPEECWSIMKDVATDSDYELSDEIDFDYNKEFNRQYKEIKENR